MAIYISGFGRYYMVGQDTPEPNAFGDYTDLADGRAKIDEAGSPLLFDRGSVNTEVNIGMPIYLNCTE